MIRALSDRRLILALFALLALVCALQALAYRPGMMTWDSIRQYDQALSGDFDDWHPPAMEWLWRRLLVITPGPAPMLAVQLALYWGGVALWIGWAVRAGRRRLALLIVAGALMPVTIVLMATIIKDSLMAGLLMLASAGLAVLPPSGRWWLRGPALALLLAAATLRFNALPACLPLAIALLPAAWRASWPRAILSGAVCAVLLVAALPLANRALGARPSGVGLSLVIFDLGGTGYHAGSDLFPPIPGVADPVAVNRRCYTPNKWDSYSWWVDAPCPIGFEPVQAAFARSGESPYRHWLTAIATHPFAYAAHRFTHFNINSRFLVHDWVERPVQDQIPENDWGIQLHPNALLTFFDRAARWSALTPLGWPIAWMALALGVLIVAPALPSKRLIIPLALSGLLYGLGYLPASVAAELRYHLWTMLATMLAAAIALDDLRRGPQLGRRHLIGASAPLLIVLILGTVWRIA